MDNGIRDFVPEVTRLRLGGGFVSQWMIRSNEDTNSNPEAPVRSWRRFRRLSKRH